uniref:Reverse transcriptase domain-containing protein n=1 Tax=Tanacetum cinerariifolium TaxID=118510 RepID=A0A6L2JLA7_TANCI|nr:hypothetical protein [Tanacetum cinerariifolium]
MAQLRCSNCGLFNGGICLSCSIVGFKNEFINDPKNYDNTPDFSYQPPQHHVDTYSCGLCGNDSHYGYDFPPRNEKLNTIPKKESDEFIESNVEDLVPIPSVSEDTSGSESVCILPLCDDFSPIYVPEEKAIPLFEFDDEYISSDVNPLFDKVLEDIECKDSYYPNLDELTFLVTFLFDSNEDEYFTPSDDIELLLHQDPSIPKMSVASILKGFTDEPPLEENDDLFDLESKIDDWKKILYDAPILMTEDKIFDPRFMIKIFLQHM